MTHFHDFVSNTYASEANQLSFSTEGEVRCGRIFYKITVGGEYDYSLLFSSVIDSTYGDGTLGHKNQVCDDWRIHRCSVGRCSFIPSDFTRRCPAFRPICELTFDAKTEKEVMPGEFFACDPVRLSFEKGEYLCLEIEFSGGSVPYHEETQLPVYVKRGGEWVYDRRVPQAAMVGCRREVKGRISYLGDSITQGIGVEPNSYLHWNALLSERLGEEYAYWNLGIGFGRANDAASDGAWLYKAKQNDAVFVCFGVNDISRGFSEEQVKADLTYIVKTLKGLGIRVVIQSIPPFDQQGESRRIWLAVNDYIRHELAPIADGYFDCVSVLGSSKEEPWSAKYDGHPSEAGCAAWAEGLYEAVKDIF